METYEKTENKGIDYGLNKSNINIETGIRFGVIPAHNVDYWNDEAELFFPAETCAECNQEAGDLCEGDICEGCGSEIDFSETEPTSIFIDKDNLIAEQSCDGPDIFIIKSDFYTFAQFCSPCAPGACYLPSPIAEQDDNNKCYCFGPDWFDGAAPYDIYSVKTNEKLN